MPHQIGCKHCKGISQKQFGVKISTSQEKTQTTSPNMFAPSTSYQKERTSLVRKEDVTGQERGQNTNVYLKTWDDKQCRNWKLWAYTDGSCIGKAENFISAGVVYCPQTKAECYVD